MLYSLPSFEDLMAKFKTGQEETNNVSIDIEGGENDVAPLILLRAFQGERTLEAADALAVRFLQGKKVTIKHQDTELLLFTFDSKRTLESYFLKAPWLLDIVYNLCWALLIKKLTPPLEGSKTEENG